MKLRDFHDIPTRYLRGVRRLGMSLVDDDGCEYRCPQWLCDLIQAERREAVESMQNAVKDALGIDRTE